MRLNMPPQLAQRARELIAGGEWTPPPPRPAATVVLLRDGDHGVETVLLQRAKSLGFAGSMYVFPGGAIDADDAELGDPWLVAAIRETYEEVGILLATPPPPPHRLADLREAPLAAAVRHLGVALDFTALRPFAHWVTPELEPRRFDTRFFAAVVPAGQELGDLTSEHAGGGWFSPHVTGLPMLPPTQAALAELQRFATVADVLAEERTPVPIMPRPVAADGDDIEWALVNAETGERLQ